MSYLDTTEANLNSLNREELNKMMQNLFSWSEYYFSMKRNKVQFAIMQNKIRAVQRKLFPNQNNKIVPLQNDGKPSVRPYGKR